MKAQQALSAVPATLSVRGVVDHGDQRGRSLGFPTANVAAIGPHIEDGVWAGTVQLRPITAGPVFTAAISVGRRPTYYSRVGERLIEAHLLDYSGDLYGQLISITFYERLRAQHRYLGDEQLIDQLWRDVLAVRAWAGAHR